MPPVPVILLLLMVPSRVRVILLVPFFQVASVGAVFAIIPIVVAMVARIVDSDLYAGFLRLCGGQGGFACHKGSGQARISPHSRRPVSSNHICLRPITALLAL